MLESLKKVSLAPYFQLCYGIPSEASKLYRHQIAVYADDTQFCVSFSDIDELNNEATARRRIVQAFSIKSNFMKSSHLKLNPSKTIHTILQED